MMGWTAPDGIAVPSWPVMSRANRGAVRDDDYHDRIGCCEERLPGTRDRCCRQRDVAAQVAARTGRAVLCGPCSLCGGPGGVRRRASLGAAFAAPGARGADDAGALRQAL